MVLRPSPRRCAASILRPFSTLSAVRMTVLSKSGKSSIHMPLSPAASFADTSSSRRAVQSPEAPSEEEPAVLAGAFSDASLNSSGRSSTRTSTAGAITRSHRQRFSSCRTLPGKRNASSRASASGVRRFASTPSARASVRRKCSARGAMSSGRSRNGGRRSRITFRR